MRSVALFLVGTAAALTPGAFPAPRLVAGASRSAAGVSMLNNPLARFFGDKKQDSKKKQESALAATIDQALVGAPLPAKMLANLLIKPLANSLAAAISQGADDANDLVEEAVRALQRDPEVAAALGVSSGAIEAGPIFSSMGGSSNINGRVSKSLSLQFQLAGGAVAAARGQGGEDGRMKLIDVRVQTPGGRMITATGAAGGGGGGGGFSGGAGGGASGGIIDVDATVIDV